MIISISSNNIFCVFGCWWPVPAFSNSPFRRYLSNGPYAASHFALQPQFRTTQSSTFFLYADHTTTVEPRKFRRFPIFGRFRNERTSRGVKTWPFQYRTPRSRPVIRPPRSILASTVFLLPSLRKNFNLRFFL